MGDLPGHVRLRGIERPAQRRAVGAASRHGPGRSACRRQRRADHDPRRPAGGRAAGRGRAVRPHRPPGDRGCGRGHLRRGCGGLVAHQGARTAPRRPAGGQARPRAEVGRAERGRAPHHRHDPAPPDGARRHRGGSRHRFLRVAHVRGDRARAAPHAGLHRGAHGRAGLRRPGGRPDRGAGHPAHRRRLGGGSWPRRLRGRRPADGPVFAGRGAGGLRGVRCGGALDYRRLHDPAAAAHPSRAAGPGGRDRGPRGQHTPGDVDRTRRRAARRDQLPHPARLRSGLFRPGRRLPAQPQRAAPARQRAGPPGRGSAVMRRSGRRWRAPSP